MSVTFGLSGLPLDAYDDRSGARFLDGYDKSVALLGPEFTTLWANDHFQEGESPQFECWTHLCFLASRFERFKVGSLVLGQGYRNPALLAKMAATLQFLTDGRLVLGIGAGWKEREYRSYGYEYPSRKERVDQLVEVIEILRLLWQGGPATFHGRYYSIDDAYCRPVPATPIPIMFGSSKPRMVRLAAEYGDGWNCDASPDVFDSPHAQFRDRLQQLGRAPDEVEISLSVIAYLPEDATNFVGLYRTPDPEYDNDQIIYGPTAKTR